MELDKGHKALLEDLENLLEEAKAGQFHDFINSRYATPKLALSNRLELLRRNVMAGKYDNGKYDNG